MNLFYRPTQTVGLLGHKQMSLLLSVCTRRPVCVELRSLHCSAYNKGSWSKTCILTHNVQMQNRFFAQRYFNSGICFLGYAKSTGRYLNKQSTRLCVNKHILLSFKTGTKVKKSNLFYPVRCLSDSSDSHKEPLIDDPDLKKIVKKISKDFKKEKADQDTTTSATTDTDSGSDTDDSDDSDGEADKTNQGTTNVKSPPDPPKNVTQSKADQAIAHDVEIDTDTDIIFEDEVEVAESQELVYEEFDDELEEEEEEYQKPIAIDLERGETGVYDIEDMVTLLRDENMADLFVIRVPEHLRYVDYLVLATGKSLRQLRATAELLKHIYKKRREKRDPASVKIEGMQSTDWLAMDFGNIAVHLFLHDTRQMYDLETLWTVGDAFDTQSKEEVDPFALSTPSFMLEDNEANWHYRTEPEVGQAKETEFQSDNAWREGNMETFTDWHKRHP